MDEEFSLISETGRRIKGRIGGGTEQGPIAMLHPAVTDLGTLCRNTQIPGA